MDDTSRVEMLHPTWEFEYLGDGAPKTEDEAVSRVAAEFDANRAAIAAKSADQSPQARRERDSRRKFLESRAR
jgi:hypothetical protein